MREKWQPPGTGLHGHFQLSGTTSHMNSLETRASLLLRIRDTGDGSAWSEFIDLYMPLLHSYGMRRGLQDSDAADLAQETVRQVIRTIGRFAYDRNKGSFRGWLLSIARNEIRKYARKNHDTVTGSGDTRFQEMLGQQPAPDEESDFEQEYRLRLFQWACEKVRAEFREKTWQAFWRTTVEGEEAAPVAERLGISLGAVYIARSRVLARIREEIALAERED